MGGLFRYLALNAQVRAGFSAGAVIWAGFAIIASALALVLLIIAAFFWLADRYDPIKAGLILGGIFLVTALFAAIACVIIRRRNVVRAQRELAERKAESSGLFDPKLIAAGLQIVNQVGWRRVGSLAVVALVAAGVAYEWLNQRPPPPSDKPPEN
jgi:uncharacterized membrane protein YbhN (UPF0104 family)